MDRFKFRVWEIKQKKYRQRTHHEADTCINCLSGKVLFGEGIEIYGEEDDKDVTLEQCTGLKDKNGKLIYEGDIVEIFSKNRYAKGIYQIKFDCNDCEYDLFDKDDNFLYQLESGKSEYLTILGNIHENKELLDMSNLEELNYAIISELRDQLEAKEQMIKDSKESISRYQKLVIKQAELLTQCRNWLKGLILCTLPMESTEDLEDLIEKIDEVLK